MVLAHIASGAAPGLVAAATTATNAGHGLAPVALFPLAVGIAAASQRLRLDEAARLHGQIFCAAVQFLVLVARHPVPAMEAPLLHWA